MPTMPSDLPFKLTFATGAGVRTKSCSVTIQTDSDEAADELADLLEAMCVVAGFGCFGTWLGGGEQSVKILPGASIAHGRWVGELSAHAPDPAFWRVYLQICAQYHRIISPINHIELGVGRIEPLAVPYSPAPSSFPFVVERDAVQPETPAVIRLDAKSWSPETVEKARIAFEDWGSIVYSGGFFPPNLEMDEPPFDMLRVNLLGQTRLECVAEGWRSNDAAIDAALALCVGIHNSIQPLIRAEVE